LRATGVDAQMRELGDPERQVDIALSSEVEHFMARDGAPA
jgi:hypothetical protein